MELWRIQEESTICDTNLTVHHIRTYMPHDSERAEILMTIRRENMLFAETDSTALPPPHRKTIPIQAENYLLFLSR